MEPQRYVHGYHPVENTRLVDQATTLADLLHCDTAYAAGSRVLEAGCGVGAQTVFLARSSPEARITSVDVSAPSLEAARVTLAGLGLANVTLQQADVFNLPFEDGAFDHVFVCFLLEHLSSPVEALLALQRVLRRGGTLTVIEGDHGSAFFHPRSEAAERAVQCLVTLQARMGGDALIGRRLYPLLRDAGLADVRVSPRMVYADASRPELVDGFTRKTFAAMVAGVREEALAAGLVDEASWEEGIRGLYRAAEADGVFCYTFFKAVATKP